MKLIFYLTLLCCILIIEPTRRKKEWYQHATMYQIYPRSFMDSDGNGVGDLKGITSKLTHLRDIGVNTIWISPIFQSPQFDFGYDVSDFKAIDSTYGTMTDFNEMMREIKRLDLKILLDFVPNHSSHEHEWFIKSSNREEGYENYYIWHDGIANPDGGQPLAPNNWVAVFGGSAWTWNEKRQQYYLHQFYPQQPDLNYREPKVVAAMKEILVFWLTKGVDGFRLDAINHMFEDERFLDEPVVLGVKPLTYDSLEHIYTKNIPEVYDFVYDCREILDKYQKENGGDSKVLMTEAYANIYDTMRYYHNYDGSRQGAQLPFNFGLIYALTNKSNAFSARDAVNNWIDYMPPNQSPNWVLSTHDHSRTGSRLEDNKIDMLYTMLHTLPGTSITYFGEEIGMPDYPGLRISDHRDPGRTPMQWNNSTSAGFSTSKTTWLPVNPNYKTINVEKQKNVELSHYNHYKSLTKLRSKVTMIYGDYNPKILSDEVFAFTRELLDHNSYLVILNFSDKPTIADASDFVNLKEELTVKIVNCKSAYKVGDVIALRHIILRPYDGLVLKSSK